MIVWRLLPNKCKGLHRAQGDEFDLQLHADWRRYTNGGKPRIVGVKAPIVNQTYSRTIGSLSDKLLGVSLLPHAGEGAIELTTEW